MKTLLALSSILFLASCGGTLTYTDPVSGVTYTEVIDGKLNGNFTIPPTGIDLGEGKLIIEPAK